VEVGGGGKPGDGRGGTDWKVLWGRGYECVLNEHAGGECLRASFCEKIDKIPKLSLCK